MLGISICDGRFQFGKKIGSGSFGSIYYGVDTQIKSEVAIKVESSDIGTSQLEYEAKLYKVLGARAGIPLMHWHGQESGCRVMVLDLLGPSLQDLFNFVDRPFSLKTVLQIGRQVVDILEYLHTANFVHRDLKPANFLVGRGDSISQVQLIDFGLAKRYWMKTGVHIPWKQKKSRGVIGSARYASVNAHQGTELSRRDDLESAGYMFVHFLKGVLPWQNLDPPPETKELKNQRIGRLKAEIKFEVLCSELPACFSSFLLCASCLDFEESPNYSLLQKFFSQTAQREGISFDADFDWTQRRQEGEEVEHTEEDDRLSCNLSQVSLGSTGEDSVNAAVASAAAFGPAPRPRAADGSDRTGVSSAAARGGKKIMNETQPDVAVGPLLRVAKSGTVPSRESSSSAASLARAMQTAGVADGPLWNKMKQFGIMGKDGDEAGSTTSHSDVNAAVQKVPDASA